MSASPLRTASNVPGGAATARGNTLHLILPGTFCSSIAHHSTCVVLSECVVGTQVDSVSVVCAAAGAAVASSAADASAARSGERVNKRTNGGMRGSSAKTGGLSPNDPVRPIAENAGGTPAQPSPTSPLDRGAAASQPREQGSWPGHVQP